MSYTSMPLLRLYEHTTNQGTELKRHRLEHAVKVFSAAAKRIVFAANSFFSRNPYAAVPAQDKALQQACDLATNAGGTIVHIDVAVHNSVEFLACTRARFEIEPALQSKCFTKPVDRAHKGFVDVLLYTGLTQALNDVMERNSLVEEAVEQRRYDEVFDVSKVIPVALAKAGAQRMTVRVDKNSETAKKQWYKLPDGSIVAFEVEAYATLSPDSMYPAEPATVSLCVKNGKVHALPTPG